MSGFGGGFGGFGQANNQQQQSTPAFGSGFGASNPSGRSKSPLFFPLAHVSRTHAVPTRRESCRRAMEPSSNPSLTRIFPRDRLWFHDHARIWQHRTRHHWWRALWHYFWWIRKFWRYVDDAVDPSPMASCSVLCSCIKRARSSGLLASACSRLLRIGL